MTLVSVLRLPVPLAVTAFASLSMLVSPAGAVEAGGTQLLSLPAGSSAPFAGLVNGSSLADAPAVSADGTRVVFTSGADGLVSDTGDDRDGGVYVRDLATRTTTLVSVGNDGQALRGSSSDPSISADATGSDSGPSTSSPTPTPPSSGAPAVSADGRYVAFVSSAPNLGAQGGTRSVFVRDLRDGRTVLACLGGAGAPTTEDASAAVSPCLSRTRRPGTAWARWSRRGRPVEHHAGSRERRGR